MVFGFQFWIESYRTEKQQHIELCSFGCFHRISTTYSHKLYIHSVKSQWCRAGASSGTFSLGGRVKGVEGGDGKATTFLLWPLATRLYPPATRCESAWWYICLPRGLLTGEVQKKGFIRRAFNWQGRPFLGTLIHLRFVRYIKRQNIEANLSINYYFENMSKIAFLRRDESWSKA